MTLEGAPREQRRATLVALVETQRRFLVSCVDPWRRPLAIADRGVAAAQFLKAHPAWVLGTAFVGSVIAPRALQGLPLLPVVRQGFFAWKLARRLTSLLPHLASAIRSRTSA